MNPTPNPKQIPGQLAPIFREHHDSILFVSKLREGLKNETSVDTLRKFCNWYWKNHIKPLFHEEEKILLSFLPGFDALVLHIKNEHNDIRDLILDIDRDPDTVIIRLLADFLEQHIRFENRNLFPRLESKLSTLQLKTIYQQLEDHPVYCTEWNDEFWISKVIN